MCTGSMPAAVRFINATAGRHLSPQVLRTYQTSPRYAGPASNTSIGTIAALALLVGCEIRVGLLHPTRQRVRVGVAAHTSADAQVQIRVHRRVRLAKLARRLERPGVGTADVLRCACRRAWLAQRRDRWCRWGQTRRSRQTCLDAIGTELAHQTVWMCGGCGCADQCTENREGSVRIGG